MIKIKRRVKEIWDRPYLRFILLFLLLFILWQSILRSAVYPLLFSESFTDHLAYLSTKILNSLSSGFTYNKDFVLYKYDNALVQIGDPCNGMEFLGLIVCFSIAFPASIRAKFLYLSISLPVVHFLNVIRIIVLAILSAQGDNFLFDLNHKYLFEIIIYGAILLITYYWVRHQIKKA